MLPTLVRPYAAAALLMLGQAALSQTPAPAAEPVSLDQAISLALANHQQVKIAESQRVAADARVASARSAFFPYVEPVYRYSRQRTSFNAGEGRRTGTLTQDSTAINLTQTLWDSGRREQNVARVRDAARAVELDLVDTRQQVALNAATAWFEARRAHDLVRVAHSGADRARATLEATRAFVEAGTSPRKDVLQALADYENARVQSIAAENNVRLAGTVLRNALGLPPDRPVEAADTPLPTPDATPETRTISDFVDVALANRPDLRANDFSVLATARGLRLARIAAGPQLSSSISAGYRVDPDPGTESQLMMGVSYPLFDAGAARAGVREARAAVSQAEQSRDLLRQAAVAEVESAYLLREEARARLSATQAALSAARENYEAASESRREGAGTILDVITAQNQLVTAETSAVQAVYDFHTADARLRRATGEGEPQAARTASVPQGEPA